MYCVSPAAGPILVWLSLAGEKVVMPSGAFSSLSVFWWLLFLNCINLSLSSLFSSCNRCSYVALTWGIWALIDSREKSMSSGVAAWFIAVSGEKALRLCPCKTWLSADRALIWCFLLIWELSSSLTLILLESGLATMSGVLSALRSPSTIEPLAWATLWCRAVFSSVKLPFCCSRSKIRWFDALSYPLSFSQASVILDKVCSSLRFSALMLFIFSS